MRPQALQDYYDEQKLQKTLQAEYDQINSSGVKHKNRFEANKILNDIQQLRINNDKKLNKELLRKIEQQTKTFSIDEHQSDKEMHSQYLSVGFNSINVSSLSTQKQSFRTKKCNFGSVSRDQRENLKEGKQHISPPPGSYAPKYGFTMKRPVTNTFGKSLRFKEDSQKEQQIQDQLLELPMEEKRSMYKSIRNHRRRLTATTFQSLQVQDKIGTAANSSLDRETKGNTFYNMNDLMQQQNTMNTSFMSNNRPLLCLSFDQYKPRKEFIQERTESPHESRFDYNANSSLENRTAGVTFDKQVERKFDFNIGMTGLVYDYQVAQDKCKFDESIKKVLPFQREKIDYKKRKIDFSKIKYSKETVNLKALRRKINIEDNRMILNLMVKPLLKKSIKEQQERHKSSALEQLFAEYDSKKMK